MTQFNPSLPVDVPMLAVDLVPQRTLGGGQGDRLTDRVRVGGPIVVPLTADRVPAGDLADYILQEAAHSRYSLLHLRVSFVHDARRPISDATVAILLEGDGQGDPPLAWSLDPKRETRQRRVGITVALGAKLDFVEPRVERTTSVDQEIVVLTALGELRSDPEWRFQGDKDYPLDGMYALSLVAKIAAGRGATARCAIGGRVERGMALIPYRAAIPEQVTIVVI